MGWVEIYEAHTPYEWAMQKMLMAVDPWGDERDDLRHAINTTAIRGDADNSSEVIDVLTHYLVATQRPSTVGPAAMKAAMEAMQ